MSDNNNQLTRQQSALQQAVDKRRAWFYECQLRQFNLQTFHDILDNSTDKRLDLISEINKDTLVDDEEGIILGKRVYLDSRKLVWTETDKQQRDKFGENYIGKLSNWLDLKKPFRIAAKIAELRTLLEKSTYHSSSEKTGALSDFDRKEQKQDDGKLPHILSRVAITQDKPWLIPEIFHTPKVNTANIEDWVTNAEQFISGYEKELMEYLGKKIVEVLSFDPENTKKYQEEMQKDMLATTQVAGPTGISTGFYEYSEQDKKPTWGLRLETTGSPKAMLSDYPHSEMAKRWGYAFDMKGLYLNLANSDMGLCLLMRALYLYGRLPASFSDKELFTWRNRTVPGDLFDKFIDIKYQQAGENSELQHRIKKAGAQLKVLLELNAANPCSADIRYSLVAESFFRHVILGYKFWLDEAYKMRDEKRPLAEKIALTLVTPPFVPRKSDKVSNLNAARRELGEEGKMDVEMEYWSENHYIMFASSEFLAGQLWPDASFQPVKDFLEENDKTGAMNGAARMERGKARVLKWLHNRMMFGWAEFNSQGYYREHLWALLNLIDFSLDLEVRRKATIVTDLLLFDVVRFLHKGTMGACGGRSQFKFNNSGWEGGLSDVIEIMFGNKGLFTDGSGEIGFAFASSTYKIPEVLLEIGQNPPVDPFIDRSRMSITFEEAGKYGIQTSKSSHQQDSLMDGYREKRTKHYERIMKVNEAIATTHRDYGQKEDDTVFWWSLSAYYSKQIVRNTFDCIEKFHLQSSGIFKGFLPFLFDIVLPLIHRTENTSLGLLAGSVSGAPLWGTAAGFFASDILGVELEESGADDMSIFIDGSVRTRVNIYTYKSRDVVLSTVQNFRAGQLNFQSQVNQATLSGEVNVFITSFYGGINLSDIGVAGIGGLLGSQMGMPVVGAALAVAAYEWKLDGEGLLGDKEDGPWWWTGYWSLPMVVQHKNAAILAFDTHWIQRRLADHGSHAWFPRNAFTEWQEKRCASYKNKNFFLEDTFDIGPKGFWLFGKLLHGINPETGKAEEAYIGLFSNQRPKWMDKNEDPYKDLLEDENMSLRVDFFANREWFVDKNNIWIIQVGSSADFGSFENFKDQVSKAKVEMDDAGDFECTYHIPDGKGNTDKLKLDYDDGGKFKLNNAGYNTDLFPRFENPFIRSGLAAWGQREWVIEYRGQSLLHDFSDWNNPVRLEKVPATWDQQNMIRALVIYIRTGDEEMERYSVAKATVRIGCQTVATSEVIAVGKVDKNTWHDAEWIFFDNEITLLPDMTIEIEHPRINKTGEDEPEWTMSFYMHALLGDHALWNCSLSFDGFHFEDEKRRTGRFPFSVSQSKWHTWQLMDDRVFSFFYMAEQPVYTSAYYSYTDVFAKDGHDRLWYLRFNACRDNDGQWMQVAEKVWPTPPFGKPLYSISFRPGHFYVFIIKDNELYLLQKETAASPLLPDTKITIETALNTDFFGFPDPFSPRIPVAISWLSTMQVIPSAEPAFGADLYMNANDGNIYAVYDWIPFSTPLWRKIDLVSTFQLGLSNTFSVWRDMLFALDDKHRLWLGIIDRSNRNIQPDWKIIGPEGIDISKFILEAFGDVCVLVILSENSQIWTAFAQSDPARWQRMDTFLSVAVSPKAGLAATFSSPERVDYFVTGVDSKIHHTFRTGGTAWIKDPGWSVAEEPGELFTATPDAEIIARCRVKGQIELYTTLHGRLFKTWWS